MGTTIRGYGLDEAAARGERFKDLEKETLNNMYYTEVQRFVRRFFTVCV